MMVVGIQMHDAQNERVDVFASDSWIEIERDPKLALYRLLIHHSRYLDWNPRTQSSQNTSRSTILPSRSITLELLLLVLLLPPPSDEGDEVCGERAAAANAPLPKEYKGFCDPETETDFGELSWDEVEIWCEENDLFAANALLDFEDEFFRLAAEVNGTVDDDDAMAPDDTALLSEDGWNPATLTGLYTGVPSAGEGEYCLTTGGPLMDWSVDVLEEEEAAAVT
jgi:hypothetical protein